MRINPRFTGHSRQHPSVGFASLLPCPFICTDQSWVHQLHNGGRNVCFACSVFNSRWMPCSKSHISIADSGNAPVTRNPELTLSAQVGYAWYIALSNLHGRRNWSHMGEKSAMRSCAEFLRYGSMPMSSFTAP